MAQVLETLIGNMEKVGSLFGTCVRCHAVRGALRALHKKNLGLQVKQNATNTWRHSGFLNPSEAKKLMRRRV